MPRKDAGISSIAVARSITNKVSDLNIGLMLLEHSGGGYADAGTCRISNDQVDSVIKEFLTRING